MTHRRLCGGFPDAPAVQGIPTSAPIFGSSHPQHPIRRPSRKAGFHRWAPTPWEASQRPWRPLLSRHADPSFLPAFPPTVGSAPQTPLRGRAHRPALSLTCKALCFTTTPRIGTKESTLVSLLFTWYDRLHPVPAVHQAAGAAPRLQKQTNPVKPWGTPGHKHRPHVLKICKIQEYGLLVHFYVFLHCPSCLGKNSYAHIIRKVAPSEKTFPIM